MVATFDEGIDVVLGVLKNNWNRANTTRSRDQLKKMENELRRCVHLKRKGDGVNFDRLVYKTRTDLSDRSKKLYRMTFQIEVVIFAELIP